MRMDEETSNKPDFQPSLNHLCFDDGGMRGLAGALVWAGLLYHVMALDEGELKHPSLAELARSLLAIPTFYKSQGDESSAMIRRIIKQNVDSKKQAVSSYEWSMILSNMPKPKGSQGISLQDAIEMYNSNPEVCAHGSGSGKEGFLDGFKFEEC